MVADPRRSRGGPALLLAQLLVLVLGWTRSARLFALMAVARNNRS